MTQTTSGIEPVFLVSYKRRRKINPNDKDTRHNLAITHQQKQQQQEQENKDENKEKVKVKYGLKNHIFQKKVKVKYGF